MVSQDNLFVRKRNGRGKEALNIDKIHSMVGYATENITGVSASYVEMNSGLQFFDGITTEDIQTYVRIFQQIRCVFFLNYDSRSFLLTNILKNYLQ